MVASHPTLSLSRSCTGSHSSTDCALMNPVRHCHCQKVPLRSWRVSQKWAFWHQTLLVRPARRLLVEGHKFANTMHCPLPWDMLTRRGLGVVLRNRSHAGVCVLHYETVLHHLGVRGCLPLCWPPPWSSLSFGLTQTVARPWFGSSPARHPRPLRKARCLRCCSPGSIPHSRRDHLPSGAM